MAKKTEMKKTDLSAKDKARLNNRANAVWHLAQRRDKDTSPTKTSLEAALGTLAAKLGIAKALNTHHDMLLELAKENPDDTQKADE